MITIEYSSMCFYSGDTERKIGEAAEFLSKRGFQFGIQLHNSIDPEMYRTLLSYKGKLPLTVHSPVFSKHFLNLACSDINLIFRQCDDAVKILEEAGTEIFFFHGFFLTNDPIIQDMKNYRKVMRDSMGSEYCLNGSFAMNPSIFDTDKFTAFKNVFMKNYQAVIDRYPDLTIALENDYIGIGSGLQRPQEIMELTDNLWYDTGHLWTSSITNNFDFYEATNRLIESKNIAGVHINHNHSKKGDAPETLRDSHDHIYIPTAQNLKPVIQRLINKGQKHFTLEIVDGDLQDIETLISWMP